MRGYRWADDPAAIEQMRRKVPAAVGECFDLIEREMIEGPWVMGEAYTVCDPYLFTLAQWLEADGVNPARLPKIRDHRRRMSERPTVKKALAEELSPAQQWRPLRSELRRSPMTQADPQQPLVLL